MTYNRLERLRIWCQKVIPLVYDDSLSYYEVLCKVVDYTNKLIENDKEICLELGQLKADYNTIKDDMDYLSNELDKVKNGDYVSLYLNSIKKWIDENLQQMVAGIVKYVSFGLSSDGKFVAYIPKTWDFLQFDTIITPESELYGHLVMRW